MHTKSLHYILLFFVNLCRFFVSATFIFSGVVKLIDPYGTAYKIHDYLTALQFSSLLDFPHLPIAISVFLAILEFCLGIYLLFCIRRRTTLLLMSAMTLFYLPLTLWLALTDAITDCGCFGDAVHLSNWQTFWKNIILLAFLVFLWWQRQRMVRFISESAQWIVSIFTIVYALFLVFICIYREPIIDFRPFYIGQHIPTAMQWPDDPEGVPEILDFNIEGYTINTRLQKQAETVTEDTKDISLNDEINADVILSDTSYTFLLIAPYLEKADDSNMDLINAICDYAQDYGYRFLCLTASNDSAIHRWQDLTGAEYPFAFTDELTLKTIARSNPALMLLHDGTIVGKWSNNMLPHSEELSAPLYKLTLAHPEKNSYKSMLLSLLLWYLIPLGLLIIADRTYVSLRWWKQQKRQKEERAGKNT